MSESETISASNMDLIEEFERTIAGMEWVEVVFILEEMIVALMGDASTPPNSSSSPPPPPPPPPHFHPAEPDLSPFPQTEGIHTGAHSGCTPMGAALDIPSVGPSNLQQTHLNSTASAHGQEQRQEPGQEEEWGDVVWGSSCCCSFKHLGSEYGEMCQVLPAAAPLNPCSSEENQREENYVKKPLNAFKLFSKEQRSKVMSELQDKHIATVNKILRQEWKSLSREEKAEYYRQAEREQRLHEQRHTKSSTTSNYGKKKKTRQKRNNHLSDEQLGAFM